MTEAQSKSSKLDTCWNRVLEKARRDHDGFEFQFLEKGSPRLEGGKLVVTISSRVGSDVMEPYLAELSPHFQFELVGEYEKAPADGDTEDKAEVASINAASQHAERAMLPGPQASDEESRDARPELDSSHRDAANGMQGSTLDTLFDAKAEDSPSPAREPEVERQSKDAARVPWIERGGRWFPVPVEVYEGVGVPMKLPTSVLAVYEALWYYVWRFNKNNWLLGFWVDDRRLAKSARVSVRSVERARKRLEELGLILCWRQTVRAPVTGNFVTAYHYELIYPIPQKESD
jgi:hypothetical protein